MHLLYKTIENRFRFIFFLLALCNNYIVFAQEKKPIPVIFDTDIGPDYDDVGAIAMLHALADSGEATILATMASNKNPPTAAILSLFNAWFNRPDIPIGVPKGAGVNLPAKQGWDTMIVALT